MKIPLATVNVINQLSIAAPCPVGWDTMQGDDKVRYCRQCEKNVYDLSEMTSAEIIQLIQEKEGQFCAQLFRRHDGTVITADCPVGLRLRMWKRLRKSMAWAASIFAMIFLPGCPMGGGNMRSPKEYWVAPLSPQPIDKNPPALGALVPSDMGQRTGGNVVMPSEVQALPGQK